MEVSCRDDHILVRENVRVVGGTVDLIADDRFHISDVVFHGSVYLRDAAERIRVLDVLLRTADQFAALKQTEECVSRLHLPLVPAQKVSELVERLDAAVESLQ